MPQIRGGSQIFTSNECVVASGFTDFHVGAQVDVLGADETVVASGSIKAVREEKDSCVFSFSVDEVPPGEGFYLIKTGNTFRGTYTIPEEKVGTYVNLSVG
ncbi:hypothetical protein [Cellulomonas sp. FA1]|uniref:hypothetical protein n=1 Tax=Cellulomonas sp. FA1 TaxID=1346710 RepID=UPI000A98C98D|nr:hypothetical protein [Cellulomonas sp. FA1]